MEAARHPRHDVITIKVQENPNKSTRFFLLISIFITIARLEQFRGLADLAALLAQQTKFEERNQLITHLGQLRLRKEIVMVKKARLLALGFSQVCRVEPPLRASAAAAYASLRDSMFYGGGRPTRV